MTNDTIDDVDGDQTDRGFITTDRAQIRAWADAREAIPVVRSTEGQNAYTFIRREEKQASDEQLEWKEFFNVLERNDLVFVYRDDEPAQSALGYFGITALERAVTRTDLDARDIETALDDGEPVVVELEETRRDAISEIEDVVPMGGGSETRDGQTPMGGGVIIREETAPMGGGERSKPGRRVTLSAVDQGKSVVDDSGEKIGIVANVEGDTLVIDPEPGIVDRFKARFDWGEPDNDVYSMNVSHVEAVTDDRVVLEGE